MMYRKINPKNGMFVEDVILEAIPTLEDGSPDPAYIAEPVPPDAGFYHPRWDSGAGAWMEGLTPEEIAARQATQPPPELTPEERRMDQIEAALIELAEMIAGGV